MALISHLYRLSVSYLDLLGRKRQYIQRKTKAGPFFYGYISHPVLALHFLLLLRGDGRGTKQRAGRQARGASTLFFILFLSFYSPRHNHQKLQYTGRVALHSS